MAAIGYLHAFSVFLEPLQRELHASRASASAIYSVATVFFTAGMLAAPRLYARTTSAVAGTVALLLAAGGLALSSISSLVMILAGFGVVFGIANGIGYSLAVQLVVVSGSRRGLATGLVIACYALGPAFMAPLLDAVIHNRGTGRALLLSAAGMVVSAVIVGLLLPRSPVVSRRAVVRAVERDRTFYVLGISFFLASVAGLIALGHAAGIVAASGGTGAALGVGATLVAMGNGGGRILAGHSSDRLSTRVVLGSAGLLGALAAAAMALASSNWVALAGLLLTGLAYGSFSSGVPLAVADYYGSESVGIVYGQLFTAWGLAGLTSPYLAGVLFDAGGDYRIALWLCAAAATGSGVLSLALPHPHASDSGQRAEEQGTNRA